ncbi:hypothetical protein EW026_g8061 [Hermanssonia centrifuga]|uniref:Uncharacterized protein n=1 Tax=Hermanssonia centrifuga TaxID=98765 RepID=A0A4S4K7F5_9APHY|nr:hypothetical protein EW026_g8061 [Hermanssonia centrifuga]
MSPEVYGKLGAHFQLPDIRSLKRDQAKVPRFPTNIGNCTFDVAEQYVTGIVYTGPVALSCDDTKLHLSYRTYWDTEKSMHMLVGGVEVCEHLFGECRKLIKDFTYLDFIFMVPRLSILVQTAMKFMQTTDSKARASGYAHTYFDHDNVDIALLSVFPSDKEVQLTAHKAWQEVENLMELLGITTADLPAATSNASRLTHVPSTPSYSVDDLWPEDDEDVSDEEFANSDLDETEDSETAQVDRIIAAEEMARLRSSNVDDAMFSLTCAAVALSLHETNMVQNFEDLTDDERQEFEQEDHARLQHTIDSTHVPPLTYPAAVPIRPFERLLQSKSSSDLDYSSLVDIRRLHQTKCAATGFRTRVTQDPGIIVTATQRVVPSACGKILSEMNAVLCEASQGIGIGTGLEQQARISARSTVETANAALAAGQHLTTVVNRRFKIFREQGVPHFKDLGDALIGATNTAQPNHRLLAEGDYGIVAHNRWLLVGRVLTLYCRGGGKAGVHAWHENAKSIGLVSYIVMQVYELAFSKKFRAVHRHIAALQTSLFLHVPSNHFLRMLPSAQNLSIDGHSLELDDESYAVFRDLDSLQSKAAILAAIPLLGKARRKGKAPEDEE